MTMNDTMPQPPERPATTGRAAEVPVPVLELLAAARDALDCAGLDHAGMIRRMAEVRVRLDGVVATAAIDAEHPELPSLAPRVMADAAAWLRRLGGAG